MDLQILKTFGQIAGVAGLSLGVLLVVSRDIIRKRIFPNLTQEHAYRLLRLVVILVWSMAVLGIAAWAYSDHQQSRTKTKLESTPELQAENVVVAGMVIDQRTNLGIAQASIYVVGHPEQYVTEDNGNFRFMVLVDKSRDIRLHVTKSGYQTLDQTVQAPAETLTLLLRKQ
jgi:hypothetical protein